MMKKRLIIPLVCAFTLSTTILSGLSCISSQQSDTDHWSSWEEAEFKDFITTDNSLVQERLQAIVGDPPYDLTKGDFDAIRNWVASNITYKLDEEEWGVDEYWQTPEETMSLRTGDCEDFAILLCTILRAYGIDEAQLYVTIGVDDEDYGHAFLIENWYNDGEWRAIEPQEGTLSSSRRGQRFRDFSLSEYTLLRDYEIIMAFNDLQYYEESFPFN